MENKVIKTIKSRTSTRSYLNKKVPLKKLEAVLEAGKYAPSAMNKQPCNILAIRKNSLVKKFHELAMEVANRECYYGANTLILVYGPRDDRFTYQDCSCILENMFVAAKALNIASCWINQFDEFFATPDGIKVKRILGIPDDFMVVGSCALGYPSDGIQPSVKPRKDDFIKVL